jgi:tetratricopeptide (TPR) repeat protein
MKLSISKLILWALMVSVVAGLSACAARGPFLLNPDSDGTPDALQDLRDQAASHPGYDTKTRLAWATWFLTNDSKQASELFEEAALADGSKPEAHIGAGLAAFLTADIPSAQRHFLTVLEQTPESPFAELAAIELDGLSELSATFPQEARPVLEKVMAGPEASYRTRDLVRKMLISLASERGERDLSKQMELGSGQLLRYSIAGPFGDFGQLDFDSTYPPDDGSAMQSAYQIDGREIGVLAVNREEENIDFSDLSPFGGVYYTTSYIRLDKDTDVVFRLASNNLSAVLLDDRPLIVRDIRIAYPEGKAEAACRLTAGWHKVQIKLGLPGNAANFELQILDLAGNPVVVEQKAAVDGAHYADYREQPVWSPVRLDSPMERTFFNEAERDPNFFSLYLAATAASELNLFTSFKHYLDQAMRINSSFAPLHVAAALTVGHDPALPGSVSREMVLGHLNKALELDGSMAFARALLINQKLERDQFKEALADLDLLVAAQPAFYMWEMYRFNIFTSNGWIAEADRALDRALALNDRNQTLLEMAVQYYISQHRYAQAEALLVKLDAMKPDSLDLADWKLEAGDLDGAIAVYSQVVAANPDVLSHRYTLASLYQRADQMEKALAIVEAAAQVPGNEVASAPRLASLYILMRRDDDARRVLEAALEQEPRSFHLRRWLAFTDSRELMDEHITDGLELIRQFEANPFAPDDALVIVLDEYVRRYLPDGSVIGRVHTITRLQTKDALDEYGEVNRPNDGVLYQLRVIKPDGRILVPDRISGKRSVSLPNLEIGDYVEMDYVSASNLDRRVYGGRMDAGKFYFRMINQPVYRSHLVVQAPKDLEVDIQPLNVQDLNPAEVSEADGWVTHVYKNQLLAPIRTEPFMPLEDDIMPMVYYTRPLSWEDAQNYFRQRLATSRIATPELERFLSENRGSAKGRELVERLFYAIQDTVKGNDGDGDFSTPASHVLLGKRGNRLLLLSTLLNILDIPNEFILARAVNAPQIEYHNANSLAYDELLLRVRAGGDDLYLTSELETSLFGLVSPLLSGARALTLGNGPQLFITLPDFSVSGKSKEVHVLIDLHVDGSADCEVVERAQDYYSGFMRSALKRLPADRLGQVFEMQVGRDFPGATLKDFKIVNLDDPRKPLELHYSFSVKRLGKISGNQIRLPMAFFKANLTSSYIRTPSREYDMLVNGVNTGYNSTIIQLPNGMGLQTVPKPMVVESPFGRYELAVEAKRGRLILSRDYLIPIQRIGVQDYVTFYSFCAQVDQLERSDLVLVQTLPYH